ncbi:methyltransferase [Parasphingopyxis sp.]|uniref:class I SAM-dependent methyltransferase n=1 Tax=Parasphingopyxis sp. TaxID=1920299 RepID=UPI00260F277A|nr:methyltransferase [Parasphingopyxis sp.]
MKTHFFTLLAIGMVPLAAGTVPAQAQSGNASAALETVLASDIRADDRARDQYRHPAETLEFFQTGPGDTVIEYAPGGGWYTRVLAPYLVDDGQFVGVVFNPDSIEVFDDDTRTRVREGVASWSARMAEAMGIDAAALPIHFTDEIPAALNGQVDRVLIVRMLHNMMRWGIADAEIAMLGNALVPDGMIGVVQHRAPADWADEHADGSNGYVREADIIALMERNGFELVDSSEINANPNDPADTDTGVWRLPPTFARGDENREEYAAIGESDRMTLLFRKAR